VIKTTANAFEQVRDAIGKLNSYDVPECIQITIEDGSAAYLAWIASAVSELSHES
jgi:periplasmic divalent cation tolerance protein